MIRMKNLTLVGAMLAMSYGPVLAAPMSDPEMESFRLELLQFTQEMEQLPPGALEAIYGDELTLQQARESLAVLSPEQLGVIKSSLEALPQWRALPARLAGGLGSPDVAPAPPEQDEFGERLVGFIDFLSAQAEQAELPRAVAMAQDLRQTVGGLSKSEMEELGEALRQHYGSTDFATWDGGGGPESHCGGSFPSKQICEMNELITTIGDFFTGTLPSLAETAWQAISQGVVDLLQDAEGAVIPVGQEALDFFAVGGPQWWEATYGTITSVQLPCPDEGTEFLGLGEVGTMEGFYTCKRGIEWVTSIPFQLAPRDKWGLPVKIVVGLVHFPARYLCSCFERAAFIGFWDANKQHIEDSEAQLDANLGSRATQTSVDDGQTQSNLIQSDLVLANADVGALQLEAQGLIDDQEVLTAELLADFDALLANEIADDLDKPGKTLRLAIFQLPRSVGGFLEDVREVADGAVAVAAATGADVTRLLAMLAQGDVAFAAGEYRRAFKHYRGAYWGALQLAGPPQA